MANDISGGREPRIENHWCKVFSLHWETLMQDTLNIQGRIQGGRSPPPKTYESNFIHHDFVQFRKQHSRLKAILSSIVFLQQCCEVYFISLTAAKPLWHLTTKYYCNRTPNITGWIPPVAVTSAGYKHDFNWLYTLETGYSIFVQWNGTTQVLNIIFLNNLLLDCIKNAYNQGGFSNLTYTNPSLSRQRLTTKLPTMHFVMSNGCLRQ